MSHTEIEQMDTDLADTGLQRPKRSKKPSVDIPETATTSNITVPSTSSAEHDTELLMETTEGHSEAPPPPPPQSIAEDLSCKYLLFSICLSVCLSVCLFVYFYVSMCFIILFNQWKLAWKLLETKGNMPQEGGQVFRIGQHLKKLLKGLWIY